MLANAKWHTIGWRTGTKGKLKARFAAVRVRVADGAAQRIRDKGQQHLPGDEAWLIGEHRMSGEKKYYLANLPAKTDLRTLAATIKARWICEQAHQQMKEELGLDHFEGRSWQGLHRHALYDDDRLRLPPASPARNSKAGKKESTGRRLSQLCPPYDTPSSNCSLHYRHSDARIVENGFATSGGVSKSAKVVLAPTHLGSSGAPGHSHIEDQFTRRPPMTESAPFTQLQDLSTALASLVASTAPSVTAVQSHRSRSSGFVWRPGLIVTADEALSEDGEFAVTLSGGDTVPAQLVGRDPTTDVALLRVDRSDLRPVPLEAAPVPGRHARHSDGCRGWRTDRRARRSVPLGRALALLAWRRHRRSDRA